MKNETLRNIIISLASDGFTPTEIKELLAKEYGIEKSRQSIHAIYKRATEKKEEELENLGLVADIINIYARGYNRTLTGKIISKMWKEEVDYNKIRTIINSSEQLIDDVKRGIINQIADYLWSHDMDFNLQKIVDVTSYKKIEVFHTTLKEFLEEAYTITLKNILMVKLGNIYNNIDTPYANDMVKNIIKELGLDLKVSDVKKFRLKDFNDN